MSILVTAFLLWAVIKAAKALHAKRLERKRIEERNRRREIVDRAIRELEESRVVARIQREQERQAKEAESIRKEQERQAAQLEKHEKRLADLEFKAAQASADIEHLNIVLDDLRESFELACQMADKAHYAGDIKREEQAKNKVITLRNKIHSAESKIAKAQHTREMAQREMDVA